MAEISHSASGPLLPLLPGGFEMDQDSHSKLIMYGFVAREASEEDEESATAEVAAAAAAAAAAEAEAAAAACCCKLEKSCYSLD